MDHESSDWKLRSLRRASGLQEWAEKPPQPFFAHFLSPTVPAPLLICQSGDLRTLPRSCRLAKVACQQIRSPVALNQFQVADDRLDAEPFPRRQFLPRHLQTHASLGG